MSLTVGLVFSRCVRELGNSLLGIIEKLRALSNQLDAGLKCRERVLEREVPAIQSAHVCFEF